MSSKLFSESKQLFVLNFDYEQDNEIGYELVCEWDKLMHAIDNRAMQSLF